jgi:hypothetical protein
VAADQSQQQTRVIAGHGDLIGHTSRVARGVDVALTFG